MLDFWKGFNFWRSFYFIPHLLIMLTWFGLDIVLPARRGHRHHNTVPLAEQVAAQTIEGASEAASGVPEVKTRHAAAAASVRRTRA